MKRILLVITPLMLVACAGLGESAEPLNAPTFTPPPADSALRADAFDVTVDEAVNRAQIQEDLTRLQEELRANFPDTYSTLWIEHEPEYRIVIGYTGGEVDQFDTLIAQLPYADVVQPQSMAISEADLYAIQEEVVVLFMDNDIPFGSAYSDITEQRVYVEVGNPDLVMQALEEAEVTLHEAVSVLASNPDFVPPTNEGYVIEEVQADGPTILLIVQPPTSAYPQPLNEGTLILDEQDCLRLERGNGETSVVMWPNGATLDITEESIDILGYDGEVIGRVGETLRGGGVDIEQSNAAEQVVGYPGGQCPGPAWFADPETKFDE